MTRAKNKTGHIYIRATPEEYNSISNAAGNHKLSISAYMLKAHESFCLRNMVSVLLSCTSKNMKDIKSYFSDDKK